MKSRTLMFVTAMTLLAALAVPVQLAAQDNRNHHKHHHYKLIDVGTFGGPGSGIFESQRLFTKSGTLVGWADTTVSDPYAPNCLNPPDCLIEHGFQWQHGVLTDLGALSGVNNSQAQSTNNHGLVVGNSNNGVIDPYLSLPATYPVAWANGEILDLGNFGGYQGYAFTVNDSGQATGVANNAIPDQYSYLGGTQSRAFLWENGTKQDLGTLGGPDAFGQFINERGQIAGTSYTSSTPGPSGVLTSDPFLWDKDTGMVDLGNFGGTQAGGWGLNNRGEFVGGLTLPGDQTAHPFLWDGTKLRDLGTFGGNFGNSNWVNEAGDVAGVASYSDDITYHAFLWRKGNKLKDLGTLAGDRCSWAQGMNEKGQIVGLSFARKGFCYWGPPDQEKEITAQHAVLWEGGSIVDLNTLIPRNSGLRLLLAFNINNRGEIAGEGIPPGVPIKDSTFHSHAFILIPCDEKHPNIEGCDYSIVEATTATRVSPAPSTQHPAALTPNIRMPEGMLNRFRFPWGQRNLGSGTGPAPDQKQEPPANTVDDDWTAADVLDLPDSGQRGQCETDSNGKANGACPKRACHGQAILCSACGFCGLGRVQVSCLEIKTRKRCSECF